MAPAGLSYDDVAQMVKQKERDGFSATQVRTRCNMRADEYVGIFGAARIVPSDDECVVFSDGSRHYADGTVFYPDFHPIAA